jgi:uncharacterized protein
MPRIRFSGALEGYIEKRRRQEPAPCLISRMPSPLDRTEHRPWPLPAGPWVMAQSWHNLLFAHWPIDSAILRPHVASALEIDLFEGRAWIAVVPFSMTGVRLRLTPALPWFSAFPELNVRTYVTAGGKPGVWFFSLDAANPIAVAAARLTFHLPYFRARMSCEAATGQVRYKSERTHRGARVGVFEGSYRPTGDVFEAKAQSLEHFLTERYCLYAASPAGTIFRGEIHHPPWQLQTAEAEFSRNTMTEVNGIRLPNGKPLLHYAQRQDVLVWPPRRRARNLVS